MGRDLITTYLWHKKCARQLARIVAVDDGKEKKITFKANEVCLIWNDSMNHGQNGRGHEEYSNATWERTESDVCYISTK